MIEGNFITNDLLQTKEQYRILHQAIHKGTPLTASFRDEAIAFLQKYSCWKLLLVLLTRPSGISSEIDFINQRTLTRIYLEELGDFNTACDLTKQLIRRFDLNFEKFYDHLIRVVFPLHDFRLLAKVLEIAAPQFKANQDQVKCLETLVSLYEKKIHVDHMVGEIYARITSLDPTNIKALKFYKVQYLQNHDTTNTIKTLEQLIQNSPHERERGIYALELANILVYHSGKYQEALDLLQAFSSPEVDTTDVSYEAMYRMHFWDGCVRLLREMLLKVEKAEERGVLHYKVARILLQIQNQSEAWNHLEKTISLCPSFIDPYEELISLALQRNELDLVKKYLLDLLKKIKSDPLKTQLRALIDSPLWQK